MNDRVSDTQTSDSRSTEQQRINLSPSESQPTSGQKRAESESIGLLFIHGVGDQGAFEHMSSEVTSLLAALENDDQVADITVHTATSPDGAFGARTATWCARSEAPVRIDFTVDGARKQFHCHEVWWSDLDDDNKLSNQLRFWMWGLGQWFSKRAFPTEKRRQELEALGMEMPQPPRHRWMPEACIAWPQRLYLFLTGMFFFLVGITLGLFNAVLSRFLAGRIPGPKLLSEYVGDVKLYQQKKWLRSSAPLTDIHNPPRVCIRRRTITAMVELSLAAHDRWYVLAHSLGTIVAWNGLTETEHCLPNYLSEDLWQRCRDRLNKQLPGTPPSTRNMMPGRPSWLAPKDCIDRQKLFANLRGLITYGSPLDKFALLWPKIVPINTRAATSKDYEWINVYDPTDPVSGSVDSFGDHVTNLGYRAHWALLFSHLCYLKTKKGEKDSFSNRLVQWFYRGGKFSTQAHTNSRWLNKTELVARKSWSYTMQITSFLLMLVMATYLTAEALVALSSGLANVMEGSDWQFASLLSWPEKGLEILANTEPNPGYLMFFVATLTGLCGIIVRLHNQFNGDKEQDSREKDTSEPMLRDA